MARFHHSKPLDDIGGVVVFGVGPEVDFVGRFGVGPGADKNEFRALVIQQSQVFAGEATTAESLLQPLRIIGLLVRSQTCALRLTLFGGSSPKERNSLPGAMLNGTLHLIGVLGQLERVGQMHLPVFQVDRIRRLRPPGALRASAARHAVPVP